MYPKIREIYMELKKKEIQNIWWIDQMCPRASELIHV